ncbi:MAG: porin family protein [Chlorobium phaeobacteroides]|jgi:opacity protein-like surface antigen|nr:porin family protein [Chlorobium phaeobacteroides]
MNRIKGVLGGMFTLFCAVSFAQAATPYASASAGVAILGTSKTETMPETSMSYDPGYALTGAIGLEKGKIRFEGEVGYQKNGLKNTADTDVSIMTYMANGYVDFKLPLSPVTPYVTAGAGVAGVKADGFGFDDDSSTVLAGQVGAGAGFSVAPFVKIDLKYRYFMASDAEFDHEKFSIDSHNVMLGIRVGL